MTADQPLPDIVQAVVDGAHDVDLDGIAQAVRVRKQILGEGRAYVYQAGDRVRLNGDMRPAYLAGLTGLVWMVVGGMVGKIYILVDQPWRAKAARAEGRLDALGMIQVPFAVVDPDLAPYKTVLGTGR